MINATFPQGDQKPETLCQFLQAKSIISLSVKGNYLDEQWEKCVGEMLKKRLLCKNSFYPWDDVSRDGVAQGTTTA
jgi:hypothetical protein